MTQVFIDPALFSTGIFIKRESQFLFKSAFVTRNTPLRSYKNYFMQALRMTHEVKKQLLPLLEDGELLDVFIEIPPPTSFTSAGLWGLSFLLNTFFKKISVVNKVYLIPPSFIAQQTKKNGVDRRGRKKHAEAVLDLPEFSVYEKVNREELLATPHDDVATAFLFWYYTEKTNKTFEELREE